MPTEHGEKKIYTLNDIAKELGVNKATVSKAISGKGNLSAQTRARILAFIDQCGYRPNAVAQSLAKNQTYNIGLMMPDYVGVLDEAFFRECLRGVCRIASNNGYDVLMVRDGSDVQLDNVARTVICNNAADCHIALHWDGDGLSYDKGCFYISVPGGIKGMEPVASHWQQHDALGASLIEGLRAHGAKINGNGSMAIDLTQTSYSTVPAVDVELGNACSDHSDSTLENLADGLVQGVEGYF